MERSRAFENITQHFPKVDLFEVVFHKRWGLGWCVRVLVGSSDAFRARGGRRRSASYATRLPDGNHLVKIQTGGRGRVFKSGKLHIQLHLKNAVQ